MAEAAITGSVCRLLREAFKNTRTINLERDPELLAPFQAEVFEEENVQTERAERGMSIQDISKWINVIEPIHHSSLTEESNLEAQTLYLNILSMICRDSAGNGIRENQIQALRELDFRESNLLIKFGLQETHDFVKPYIEFKFPFQSTVEHFLMENPFLNIIKQRGGGISSLPELFFYVEDFYEEAVEDEEHRAMGQSNPPAKASSDLDLYINYIAAVL